MATRFNKVPSRPTWVTIVFLILLIVAPFLVIGFIGRSTSHIEPSNDAEDLGNIIGIDLGSSYSRVGIIRNGSVVVIPNQQGYTKTPSYVAFNGKEISVGETAKGQSIQKPDSVISAFKHLLSLPWSDRAVEHSMSNASFGIKGHNGWPWPIFKIQNAGECRSISPKEATALAFGKMKDIAEAFLEEKVTSAVVTVPAAFNDTERQAIKDTGSATGLNVIRVVNEPTAAVYAHGRKHTKHQLVRKGGLICSGLEQHNGERQVLVIDVGGGTLDVSLLELDCQVVEVLATTSDMNLGGQAYNQRILHNVSQRFDDLYGIDITGSVTPMARLGREVEKAKLALSTHQDTTIWVEKFYPWVNFLEFLSRAQFDEMTESLRHQTMATITSVLRDQKISKDSVDDVLLVGGSAHVPSIRTMLEAAFTGKIRVNEAIQPDEAVVHGAAIQAHVFSSQSSACTIGAYDDSTRLSLGVETKRGIMTQIVPRDSVTPTYRSRKFEIVGQDHDTVPINVFEGERPMTKDNIFLASFDLKHSPATPESRPQIEIIFAVDAGGLVKVSAVDVRSGRSNNTLITSAHVRISDAEIEERLMTASLHADADKKSRTDAAAISEEIGGRDGRSELIDIPQDQASDDHGNISDDPQWDLKSWLSSMISRANQAGRGYLNWLGDREELSEHRLSSETDTDLIILSFN